MAKPTTRQELVDYALRQLGAPVLEINIADEQLDDLLDDTIQYFQERHYDGVARTYLKYEFTEEDIKRGADYNPFYQAGITTAATTYPGASGPTVDQFVENSQYIKIPPHIIGIERSLHQEKQLVMVSSQVPYWVLVILLFMVHLMDSLEVLVDLVVMMWFLGSLLSNG